MTHPWTAYRNASKYFTLNAVEKEVITKHMWPVTLLPPRHPETYVICLTDKYCGTAEIAEHYAGKYRTSFWGGRFRRRRPKTQDVIRELFARRRPSMLPEG